MRKIIGILVLVQFIYITHAQKLVSSLQLSGEGSVVYNRSFEFDDKLYLTGVFGGLTDFDPGTDIYPMNIDSGNCFVACYMNDGSLLWADNFGGGDVNPFGITVSPSGKIFITGYYYDTVLFQNGIKKTTLTSNGYTDIFIASFESSGAYSWANSIGGPYYENAVGITVDKAENIYITGEFESNVDFDPGAGSFYLVNKGNGDAFLASYDEHGNFRWTNHFGAPEYETGQCINITRDQKVVVAGSFTGKVDFDPSTDTLWLENTGTKSIYIAVYDTSGNIDWAKKAVTNGSLSPKTIAIDEHHFSTSINWIYVVGDFREQAVFDESYTWATINSKGEEDLFIASYNNIGELYQVKTIGGTGREMFPTIRFDPSGDAYIAGYFSSTADFDPLLLKERYMSAPGFYQSLFLAKLGLTNKELLWVKKFDGSYYVYYPHPPLLEVKADNTVFLGANFSGSVNISGDSEPYILDKQNGGSYNFYLAKYEPTKDIALLQDREDMVISSGYDFGQYYVKSHSDTITIEIESCGDSTLTLLSKPDIAIITGEHAADFVIHQQPINSTLSSGDTTLLKLFFSPQDAGQRNAKLLIFSDDTDEDTVVMNLTGEGMKNPQTIEFDAIPKMVLGSSPAKLNASASSGLPVTFAVEFDSIASISNDTLYAVSRGTTRVFAWQEGNDDYYTSDTLEQVIDILLPAEIVLKTMNDTIQLNDTVYLGSGFINDYTSFPITIYNSGDDTLFLQTTGDVVSIEELNGTNVYSLYQTLTNRNVLRLLPTSFSIYMNPDTIGNYYAKITLPNSDSDENPFIFTVKATGTKTTQTIDFTMDDFYIRMDADPVKLNGQASSGLPVSYILSDTSVASIRNDSLFYKNPGVIVITAIQEGNENFAPADSVSCSVEIMLPPDLEVSYNNQVYENGSTFDFGTVPIGDSVSVSFEIKNTGGHFLHLNNLKDSIYLIQNGSGVFNLLKGFTQQVVTYSAPTVLNIWLKSSISGEFTDTLVILSDDPDESPFYLKLQASINKLTQTISFSLPDTIPVLSQNIMLTATASSGLPVSYTSSKPLVAAISNDNKLILYSSGVTKITAYQEGNEVYEEAMPIEQSVIVSDVLGINSEQDKMVQIFPNPASDFVSIKASLPIERIRILDIKGQSVWDKKYLKGSYSEIINLEEFNTGMYILLIKYSEQEQFIRLGIER